MADPRALLDEFAARFEAGESPDPKDWLRRVEGTERQELGSLIDNYLMTAPRRAWDPAVYESSGAKAAVERAYESIEGVSGTWPELLPSLRDRARIKRSELVRRLADALGVGTGEDRVERVGAYYHRMERGLLPAEGVSAKVIEALAGILGASAEGIQSAGRGEPAEGAAGPPAFARITRAAADEPFEDALVVEDADAPAPPAAGRDEEEDEIDRLFTGG